MIQYFTLNSIPLKCGLSLIKYHIVSLGVEERGKYREVHEAGKFLQFLENQVTVQRKWLSQSPSLRLVVENERDRMVDSLEN